MIASHTLAFLLLGPLIASAADDPAAFREAASLALIEIGLHDVPGGAYACVSIDDRRPSDEQLVKFRALGTHEIGPRDDCICVDSDPVDECLRLKGGQKACLVSVRAFELQDSAHASAELLVLCGWPKGTGQFADFEKRDGRWRYVGARTYIKL